MTANASGFFSNPEAARAQSLAQLQLAWDDQNPYLYNMLFDQELTRHDDSYCTTVVDLNGIDQVPTLRYVLDALTPHVDQPTKVIDVGCEQGEFVDGLRRRGVDAVGYDPCCAAASLTCARSTSSRVWSGPTCSSCVACSRTSRSRGVFLDRLGRGHPGSLAPIEFQRLEWILQEHIWYQLSHDHVNLFELADFASRFEVLDHGTFAAGEWGWVLMRLTPDRAPVRSRPCARVEDLRELLAHRQHTLDAFRDAEIPTIVWGAAGKGTVLVHALRQAGAEVAVAIDADSRRHGKYLEGSGVAVRAPDQVLPRLSEDSVVMVANPNHVEAIREQYRGICRLTTQPWPCAGLR